MPAKKRSAQPAQGGAADACFLGVDPVAAPVFGQGAMRPYLKSDYFLAATRQLISHEYVALAALLAASLYVRCSRLAQPDSVVFDEVHFGGFAAKYLRGEYFMDVHPPLAKMLFAAVGLLAGFTGDFNFVAIGDKYPAAFYYWMRLFPALLGVGTIVLSYLTLRLSGCRPIVCLVTALLLAVENAQITLSRYILLDSPLMFFIALLVYSFKKFEAQKPFLFGWYKSLLACGISLGLAVSSKWVGLFTIGWVGVCCLYQLWFLVGDLTVLPLKLVRHTVIRGAVLLGVPLTLYLTFFALHFNILVNDGDGASFMSPQFRATLNGNTIPRDILAPVGLGSVVTIRHAETLGGYLHSHNHFYPTGSKQQQITLYPHLDSNNNWLIEPYNDTIPEEFVPLTNGMKIRLKHVNTGRRLHSHDEKAPVSERDWQKEASCYGYEGFGGDANDDFTVEIVERQSPPQARTNVRALETIFRLRHAITGHYLFSLAVKLPDWGFDQQEVTTALQGARHLTNWYIETNENSRLRDGEIINYAVPTLLQKVTESHKRMWNINSGLTEHHNWQSNPADWPFLLRGINYWVRENKQVYLLGNAVVWWLSTVCIVAFGVHLAISVLRWQTSRRVADDKEVFSFNFQTATYVLGWLLHYAPSFLMGRQLFLHHYIPAAYFGILALGHLLELLVGYFSSGARTTSLTGLAFRYASYGVMCVVCTLSVLFYVQYLPLIYGTPWTRQQCELSQALSGWDFDCNTFHKDLGAYDSPSYLQSIAEANAAATAATAVSEANEARETPFEEPVVAESPETEIHSTVKEAEPERPEAVVPPFEVDETRGEAAAEEAEGPHAAASAGAD